MNVNELTVATNIKADGWGIIKTEEETHFARHTAPNYQFLQQYYIFKF
jgi:hypothetical protein